jgi:hypothetical protein
MTRAQPHASRGACRLGCCALWCVPRPTCACLCPVSARHGLLLLPPLPGRQEQRGGCLRIWPACHGGVTVPMCDHQSGWTLRLRPGTALVTSVSACCVRYGLVQSALVTLSCACGHWHIRPQLPTQGRRWLDRDGFARQACGARRVGVLRRFSVAAHAGFFFCTGVSLVSAQDCLMLWSRLR